MIGSGSRPSCRKAPPASTGLPEGAQLKPRGGWPRSTQSQPLQAPPEGPSSLSPPFSVLCWKMRMRQRKMPRTGSQMLGMPDKGSCCYCCYYRCCDLFLLFMLINIALLPNSELLRDYFPFFFCPWDLVWCWAHRECSVNVC